jgi:AcrR family transcriptional regulator
MGTESATDAPRRYRKRRRAELEARTRDRIAEATMRLHQTVGPARASVSAIAREAGVQRATVYRHFANDDELFAACTARYYGLHPMPDAGAWRRIGDPDDRLRAALRELYAWYDVTQDMLRNARRDREHVPRFAVDAGLAYLASARDALMIGRRERGRSRERVAAAIGHALDFGTWNSLVAEQGLPEAEAIEVMCGMVACAGSAGSASR